MWGKSGGLRNVQGLGMFRQVLGICLGSGLNPKPSRVYGLSILQAALA